MLLNENYKDNYYNKDLFENINLDLKPIINRKSTKKISRKVITNDIPLIKRNQNSFNKVISRVKGLKDISMKEHLKEKMGFIKTKYEMSYLNTDNNNNKTNLNSNRINNSNLF